MFRRILAVILAAVVGQHIFKFTRLLGLHKAVYNHRPGECKYVKGIESGAEDLELLSNGIVLISAGYLTFKDRVEGAPPGHLYGYDINRHEDGAKELMITGDYDVNKLHPHGISAYEDQKSGKIFFFVINHQVGYDVVDLFEFHRNSMSLSFIKSRQDPLMTSVNNLVAVGPEEFYITNEAYSLHPRLRFAETVLLLSTGCILFCDVTSCRKVSETLFEPNGIDLSRDGSFLYVNQPLERRVLVFKRDMSDNSLLRNQAIDLWTSPDNVYVDEAGDLWLGCISIAHRALSYLDHAEVDVPAQVMRVQLGNPAGDDYELNEVYSEDGRNLSMTTVALHHRRVLLIGTLHERMMRCNVGEI